GFLFCSCFCVAVSSDLHTASQYATFRCNLQTASDYRRSEIIMANTALSQLDQPETDRTEIDHPKVSRSQINKRNAPAASGTGTFVAGVFITWLALVLVLGARGAFATPPGAPPLGLLIGLVAPLSIFLLGYASIPQFRDFVLSVDLRLIV